MTRRATNRQLFALASSPAQSLTIADARYRLVRVFKHDFFAATSLYEAVGPAEVPRVVVKMYRQQGFCGLGLAWLGRASRDHEQAIYRALAGVEGVPRLLGPVGSTGLAIQYIDAQPLDRYGWHGHASAVCEHGREDSGWHGHPRLLGWPCSSQASCASMVTANSTDDHATPALPLPAGSFERLRALLEAVHARGVAYVDFNKRSNILIDAAGRPWLIDFQIALRRRDDLPWPLRLMLAAVVAYLQDKDLYHLYKHKRRLARQELTDQEEALSRRRGGWHGIHRALTKPYRSLRRLFLRRQYQSGRLVSPTAGLEDHCQPEKQTWRKGG